MSFSFQNHLAYFGGSFDPPHLGHVKAAEDLRKDSQVENVVIMPSFQNSLKKVTTTYENRYAMAKIAFPQFLVSAFEKEEKIEFTWQLIEKLSAQTPQIAFVIGTDQFENIDQWGRFPDLLGMCDWIVLLRRPNRLADSEVAIQKLIKLGYLQATSDRFTFQIRAGTVKRVLRFVETSAPALTSTQIREQFALGKREEVLALLPEGVFSFIERNKLYGT